MSAYNSHHKTSFRDERQIERMEAETMVLYPAPVPNPVLPRAAPGFSGRGMFPEGNRNLNWRAQGLRAPTPGICTAPGCAEHLAAAFYRRQREAAPYVSRRKYNRKSPSRRPHRRVPYNPPSPIYKPVSSSGDEAEQAQAAKGRYTDPHQLPSPGMKLESWIRMKLEREVTVQATPLPQRQWICQQRGSTPP